VKRDAGKWYACFSVEYSAQPLPVHEHAVGLDVGWLSFATLSDGTTIDNQRYYKRSQAKLCLAQRWHQCPDCGLSAAREHVSAQLVLGLGLSLFGLT
jgi:hypothetical protein